jgi:hypothetical protein
VGQNQNGAVANAFATGDMIDGGAGRDTIEASMINDNEVDGFETNAAPRPITENVEEVYIEALEAVTLDATRMEGVEEFWSNFSRGDMTITGVNLRGDNLDITKDVTFGVKDTMDRTNFTALFDSLSLTREAASQSNSQLLIRIADVSTETPETPLANVNLNLSFDLGEDTISLENVQSTDGTYAGLVEAIQDALALEGYAGLTVELSTPYSEVTFAGNTVVLPFVAQEILVTDPAGNSFDNVNFTQSAIEPVAGGFLVAGNASAVPPGSSSNLIESNVVLDNAGNGSLAGDVVIGGMSNSDLGVERFNVMVDRSSEITGLFTTNNDLQEVHITSLENQGDLYIGTTQGDLNEVDANAFEGSSLSLGEGAAISNLAFLDASGTAADVTFEGVNNGGLAASIQTGSGDDNIDLFQFGRSASNSTPTTSVITSTGGDNTVTVDGENTSTITLGAGNDTVTGNGVSITVNTGAGDDAVYAENTGAMTVAQLLAGTSAFDVAVAEANLNGVGPAGENVTFAELLFGRDVRVTLTMPSDDTNTAASFTEGFEAIASIEASNGFLTTERDLYEAVARAINEDAVLSKLAEASVDSNGHLTVEYLVDGLSADLENVIEIEVLGEWSDLSSAEQNNILQALEVEYQNSGITLADVQSGYEEVTDATGPVITDTVDVAAQVVPATPATYSFDLAGLIADTAGDTLTFTFDANSSTTNQAVVTLVAGADFAAGLTSTQVASNLDGVSVGGYTFTHTGGSVIEVSTVATGPNAAFDADNTVTDGVGTNNSLSATDGVVAGTTAGTDSITNGENIVNAGLGNDVIVLSSNDLTTDTVVFEGQFGANTIVHFNDAANGDVLDFSAWLDNVVSASDSEASERRIDGDIATLATIDANEVAITDFNTLDGTAGFAATITWDNMTNAQVLAALNADATFGTANADAGNDFVGTVQKSIIMIENWDGTEGNQGEYKVYQVTSEVAAADDNFTAVTLVGTVDFGASLDTGLGGLDATNIA